jgi:mannose/fructose/N-acetylgalactosamine-specific phosphotransferase system component IID
MSRAPMGKPRKGRVRRFFGWIVLIVIALSWIRMLSGLADEADVIVSIGAALLITVIPAFVGLLLIGAGTDQTSDSALPAEAENGSRQGRFLRFIGWIVFGLTAVAWIALIVALIDDRSGIVGIIIGGVVVSVIPIFVAMMLIGDGYSEVVEDQDNRSTT